jgi:hypothetical protein
MAAHQGGFFTEMGRVAGDPGFVGGSAKTCFARQPIDTTLPRAEMTLLHALACGRNTPLQVPLGL